MNNTSSQKVQPSHSDEIDIINILTSIYVAVKKNLKLIIIIVVMGIILGVLYYMNKKPIYKSYMVASSKVLKVEHIKLLIENLQLHLKNSDWDLLEKLLNLKKVHIQEIAGIEIIENRIDEKKNENNVFYLEMNLKSNAKIETYQAGIIHYIENNTYVKKRIELEKKKHENLLEDIKVEEEKLDSIRKRINDKFLAINQTDNYQANNIFIQDLAELNLQKLMLRERKYNTEKLLALVENLQVIQNFQPYNNPSSIGFLGVLIFSIGISLLVSLVLILFLEVSILVRKRSASLK